MQQIYSYCLSSSCNVDLFKFGMVSVSYQESRQFSDAYIRKTQDEKSRSWIYCFYSMHSSFQIQSGLAKYTREPDFHNGRNATTLQLRPRVDWFPYWNWQRLIKCWFYNAGTIVSVWEALCEYDKGDIYETRICHNHTECSVRHFKLVLNEFLLMAAFEVRYLTIVTEFIRFDNCIVDLARWKFNKSKTVSPWPRNV